MFQLYEDSSPEKKKKRKWRKKNTDMLKEGQSNGASTVSNCTEMWEWSFLTRHFGANLERSEKEVITQISWGIVCQVDGRASSKILRWNMPHAFEKE